LEGIPEMDWINRDIRLLLIGAGIGFITLVESHR
jgi:hypothetical protein